ncbi:MAG: LysM peptidoglycan-binding domain-containing protein [Halanaerobiales bacterium]
MKKIILAFILIFILSISTAAQVEINESEGESPTQGLEVNFKETEINEAFRLLAETAEMNVVTTDGVSGEVTVYMHSVSFFEAVEILAKKQDLEYKILHDTVIVGPEDELKERFDEKQTRVYHLNNANPEEVEEEIEHLIIDGDLKINSRMKTIMVTDYKETLQKVEELLPRIDQPRRQVSIKVRFQEVSLDDTRELGIDWSFGEISLLGVEGNFEDFEVNLDYQSLLDMLEEEGTSDMLANPRITTVEGEEASINIGDRIPLVRSRTFDEDGNEVVDISDEEVGIELAVTPRITEENKILMDLKPEVTNIARMVELADSRYPETSVKSMDTRVEVEDGKTIVLGGLIKENERTITFRVPFLSKIPFIGHLFRSEKVETEENELIIFITPEIISSHDYDFDYESLDTEEIYEYEVRNNDDFRTIGNIFNISYVRIMEQNKKISNNALSTGDKLEIPLPASRFYQIKDGDSYQSLAEEYQVSEDTLKKINNNKEIETGDEIVLPVEK